MPDEGTTLPLGVASIGIEVVEGGTRLNAAVRISDPQQDGDLAAHVSHQRWHARLDAPPSPDELTSAILALADRVMREASTEQARLPLGVALWADVEALQGRVTRLRYAPGWDSSPDGYPLAAHLEEGWGAPAMLRTAPQAAALAEAALGAGRGAPLVLYILQGRSLWDVLVANQRLVTGTHSPDGSLAHWRGAETGPRCVCGEVGHLEPLASAQAIVRNMIGRASASDESTAAMLAASGGRAEAMSAAQVARLAATGEPAAHAVITAALEALADALANLSVALRPDGIVWGGPLATSDDWLTPLRARLAARMPARIPAPPIVSARLEPHAAVLGATLLTTRMMRDTLGNLLPIE